MAMLILKENVRVPAYLFIDGVHLGEHDAIDGVRVRPARQVCQPCVELRQLVHRIIAHLQAYGAT